MIKSSTVNVAESRYKNPWNYIF